MQTSDAVKTWGRRVVGGLEERVREFEKKPLAVAELAVKRVSRASRVLRAGQLGCSGGL